MVTDQKGQAQEEEPEPTEQDLIAAIQAAFARAKAEGQQPDGCLTVKELSRETGWSRSKVRDGLWELWDAGKLEVTDVKRYSPFAGHDVSSRGYRLKADNGHTNGGQEDE